MCEKKEDTTVFPQQKSIFFIFGLLYYYINGQNTQHDKIHEITDEA